MIEYHVAGCLVEAADQLGYTLEPDTQQWPHTCCHHPDLLLPAIDAGATYAAATFAHGLLSSTAALLGEQAGGGLGQAAAYARRLAVANRYHHDQTARWLGSGADRYREALQRLAHTGTGLVRGNPSAGHAGTRPSARTLPPPPSPVPGPVTERPGGPVRVVAGGHLSAVAWSHPDGTVRLSATTATGTWQVTFSPGTPQQIIDAACV
jgi:hypothetical protein